MSPHFFLPMIVSWTLQATVLWYLSKWSFCQRTSVFHGISIPLPKCDVTFHDGEPIWQLDSRKKLERDKKCHFIASAHRAAKLFLQIVLTNPISKYAEVGLPNKKVTTGYLFPAVDDFRFDPSINMIGTNLSGIAFDRRAFFPHKNPASHLSFFPSPPIPFLLLVFTFYHTRLSGSALSLRERRRRSSR